MPALAKCSPLVIRRFSRWRGMLATNLEYTTSVTRDPSSLHAWVTGPMILWDLLSLLIKPTASCPDKPEPVIIFRHACGTCNDREGFIKPVQPGSLWFQVC
jgi:hypothetical protein